LKDIARDLNLSKTTVSMVLNNRGDEHNISKQTQQRILDYAKEKKYTPNHVARSLSLGRSEVLGLIVPNISDVFYANIARSVELGAKEFGYKVVFSSSNEDPEVEAQLIRSMLGRQVDGLIIASTQKNDAEIRWLKDSGFPFVLIDRHYPKIDTNFVIVDNEKGAENITSHLLQNGRSRIGFISIQSDLAAMQQRRCGYELALENAKIPLKLDRIRELDPFCYRDEMRFAIEELTTGDDCVDGIVFTTHYLASAGLRELRDLSISVPGEVAIISFDELGAFDLVEPPISASRQPVEEMGDAAVQILLSEITKTDSEVEKKQVLTTRLLIRKSCGI